MRRYWRSLAAFDRGMLAVPVAVTATMTAIVVRNGAPADFAALVCGTTLLVGSAVWYLLHGR